ncbi:MAG: hypothetical protein U0174_10660 [Polyangiaceae bacterium]
MRATRLLFIAAATLSAAAFTATACGGTTETPADSGVTVDATVEDTGAKLDAAKDVKADAPCTSPGIDTLELPDATVGDSGISTSTCVACLKKNCKAEIDDCNGDCDCRGAATTFVQCLQGATDFNKVVACAGTAGFNLPQDAQDKLYAVALCGNSDCNKECVPPGLLDGGDAKAD